MATFRKRGTSWQVQVRRQGAPTLTRTFKSKADAALWARDQEHKLDRAELPPTVNDLRSITLAQLIVRYGETVTPRKRGASVESYRLRTLLRHPISALPLAKLNAAAVVQYRDDRLNSVQAGTVRRELAVLQHCLEVARIEWGIPFIVNPVRQITHPAPSKARSRRLEGDDQNRLADALAKSSIWYLRPFVLLAVETGLRRGELLSLRWSDIDFRASTASIPMTKNGHPRTIPLTPAAIKLLIEVERGDERVFPISANAVRLAWERLRKKAGIHGLRLHDLRHEAVSRFFELGLSTPEVALISGHRDARMLMRYTHLRPEAVAEKLAGLVTRN